MKLKKVFNLIEKEFSKLEFNLESEEKNMISFNANATLEDYKGDVYLQFVVFESGVFHVFYTFDRIDRTKENLNLINDFNANEPFLKAYINKMGKDEKDFLEIHYAGYGEDEKAIVDKIVDVMSGFVDDDFKKTILPIVDLTY